MTAEWQKPGFQVDPRQSVRGVMITHTSDNPNDRPFHFCDVTGIDARERAAELVRILNFHYAFGAPEAKKAES